MRIALTDAEKQLSDLVRRARAGEEIVLTQAGAPVAKLAPLQAEARTTPKKTRQEALAVIRAIQDSARRNRTPGPSLDQIMDDMYDEHGLPK